MMREIFVDIETERAYQNGKWGQAFDDRNTINDWGAYITLYLGERATKMGLTPAQQREGLLKVATLAVAALEALDRNGQFAPRHYDPQGSQG